MQVIVRVYANVKGLAKTYKEMEILPESASLDEFVRGFNMVDAMCDYVDAGNGKECSDEKVKGRPRTVGQRSVSADFCKATFRNNLADVHCQQVFFGGTADNGYARLLGPFIEDEMVRRRITLLEGPPFAHELADIKDRFSIVSFDNVFRSQKLVNIKRRVSFHLTPPGTPSADYATAAARAPSTPIPASATQQGSAVSRRPVMAEILQNRLGQRVDSLLSYSQQDFLSLKSRKLCNSFHLLRRCPYLDNYGNCQHEHGERLNDRQMVALRAVARQSPCPSGLYCSDPDCLFGHRCTRDNCLRTNCRFSPDMHDVNTNVVS